MSVISSFGLNDAASSWLRRICLENKTFFVPRAAFLLCFGLSAELVSSTPWTVAITASCLGITVYRAATGSIYFLLVAQNEVQSSFITF